MSRTHDLDWDQQGQLNQDALLAAKRVIEQAESQRVGWEPDWKLQLVIRREQREEAFSEACRRAQIERAARPGEPERRAELMREAWARGAFAGRKQRRTLKTPELETRCVKMRAAGCTYAEIARACDVSVYTVARWLGWERKAKRGE